MTLVPEKVDDPFSVFQSNLLLMSLSYSYYPPPTPPPSPPPTPIHPSHDLYFVGAVIALACAIFAGGNSILQGCEEDLTC